MVEEGNKVKNFYDKVEVFRTLTIQPRGHPFLKVIVGGK